MVIVGLLPFSALALMTLLLAVWVVAVPAAAPEPVSLLLLSSLPQAARPRARASASSARTLRDRMRRFLLEGWWFFSWDTLSPRGVTARCSAANRSSAPIAS